MSATVSAFGHRGTTSSVKTEIVRELVNATDGAGLHLDGTAGNIDIASPPDLGTKFSFEFVLSAVDWATASYRCIIDFGSSGRFRFGQETAEGSGTNLSIYDTDNRDFGVSVLDDGKVHHLVVTINGTAAVLYDNGNQVGTTTLGATPTIDSATDARIGSNFIASSGFFNGTIYRARFYNKTLSPTDVQTAYERADVDFSSQYGSQTELVTNGDFASATGWSQNNVTIAGDGNAVWAVSGGDQWVRRADWNITAGKKYRITVVTSAHTDNGSFTVQTYGASGTIATTDLNGDAFTISGTGTHIFEFEALADSSGGVLFGSYPEGAAYVGTMTDLSCVQIGVVSDYDLAFANPKNSFKIKDRSGAADGTASNDGTNPTGISQVQVIKQLNASELMVGGDVLMTSDASGKPVLTLQNTYSDEYGPEIVLERLNQYENDNDFLGTIRFKGDNNAQESTEYATIYSQCTKVNDGIEDGNLIFRTMKDGTLAARLTIGSDGLATFANGITVSGGIVSLSSFTNLDVSSGGITVTSSTHRVDTESGAPTDNLNNINGGTDGSILVLRTNVDGRDVTVKDGTGNLHLAGDYALNNSARKLTLIKSGSDWFELSRSSNA